MADIKEIYYTICPVGNASYIAANHGFLKNGLAKYDVEPIRLQTLEREKWAAHFNYQNDRLFREGGNIPPLWAKSNGAEVILIGLNLLRQRLGIIARADSKIEYPYQLRHARIGIPAHPNALIDFHKATAQEAFELALAAQGIAADDADFVDLIDENDFLINKGVKRDDFTELEAVEIEALDSNKIDAAFVKLSKLQKLLDTGKYKIIYELSADRSQFSPVNNEYPNTLTVSKDLAQTRPEIVVEYVKQLLLAAEWAAANKAEAEKLLAEQTYGTVGQYQRSFDQDFYKHLEINLSEESLFTLESQERFLYNHGYLKQPVDVYSWADDYFLKTAVHEIKAERLHLL